MSDDDRQAEVTDFGEKPPMKQTPIESLPFEERVGLLFLHDANFQDLAIEEKCTHVDIESAVRRMMQVLADRLHYQTSQLQKLVERFYARHMQEVGRDIPFRTDEDHYRSRERLDVYGRAAQELQDELLNFQPRARSVFTSKDEEDK